MSDKKAAKIFFAALDKPHKLLNCGTCLIGCVNVIFGINDSQPCNPKNLSEHPDVWRAIVRFLSLQRTKEEMQTLLLQLGKCNCNFSDRFISRLHDSGQAESRNWSQRTSRLVKLLAVGKDPQISQPDPPSVHGSEFPLKLFSLLYEALRSVNIRKVARGSLVWPSNSSELIPFGQDAFADALLQWWTELKDGLVFVFIGVVLRISGNLVFPALQRRQTCKYLVEGMRDFLDKILLSWERSDQWPGDHRIAFREQADSIQDFIRLLMRGDGLFKVALVRGWETKFCQLCSLFIHVFTDPQFGKDYLLAAGNSWKGVIHSKYGEYVQAAHYYYREFHMHLPPRPAIPLHPVVVEMDQATFPPPASVRDPPSAAAYAIDHFREDIRCAGLNCDATIQSKGKEFQNCAGCCVVNYCGRACQLQDWRNPEYPHKRVCPILRNLVATVGGMPMFKKIYDFPTSRTVTKVEDIWKLAGIPGSDLQYINEWQDQRLDRDAIKLPDGTEWTPGFDDYEDIVWKFGKEHSGERATYPNRLARWPSEVANVKRFLQEMPYFEEE